MKITNKYMVLFLVICNITWSQESKTIVLDSTKSDISKKVQSLDNQNIIKIHDVFKMHPNPAKNELFVIGTLKIKNIEIINILGKHEAVFNFDRSIIRLNISNLKTGIYIIKVIDENNKQEVKKLVIK